MTAILTEFKGLFVKNIPYQSHGIKVATKLLCKTSFLWERTKILLENTA